MSALYIVIFIAVLIVCWKIYKEFTENDNSEQKTDEFSIEYSCGHITKITPEPTFGKNYYDILGKIRAVKFIISDGTRYDLTDVRSVNSITVKKYLKPENDYYLSNSGSLESLMFEKALACDDKKLGLAYLRKAAELIKISDIRWTHSDCRRFVLRFNDFGEKADALEFEKWYKSNILTDAQEAELIVAGKIEGKLSLVQKERIMVNKITTQDMLRFDMLPYNLNFPIKKIVEEGAHPAAYIELDTVNQDIARSELTKINEYIAQAVDYIPKLTRDYEIQIDKIVFAPYTDGYGYSIIMCTPYTFSGKISKYPISLLFMSRLDIETYSVNGELFYGKDGNILKASVNVWKRPHGYKKPGTGWLFSFKTIGRTLVLHQAKSTLFADNDGVLGLAYEFEG